MDDLLGLLAESVDFFSVPISVETKESAPENVFFFENTKESVEEYLSREERILSLAKEDFLRRKVRTFTSLEEKLLSAEIPSKTGFFELLRLLAKKVIRPILRTVEKTEDAAAQSLLSMMAPCFHITMEVHNSCRYFASKHAPFLRIELSEEDSLEEPAIIWGMKDKAHASGKRNVHYKNGEMVADMGELLALLLIVSVLKKAMADPAEVAYLKSRLSPKSGTYPYSALEKKVYEEDDYKHCQVAIFVNTSRYKPFRPEMIAAVENHCGSVIFTDESRAEWEKGYELAPRKGLPLLMGECEFFRFYTMHFFEMYEEVGLHWSDFREYYNGVSWPLPQYGYSKAEFVDFLSKLFLVSLEKQRGELYMLKEYAQLNASYAKSFEQKKNIPAKTLEAMKNSSLNEEFGFVEFDEMVDLEKIIEVEKEFLCFKQTFFQTSTDAQSCAIRFRRLLNHKAWGLYYPGVRCLCVDVRHPSSFIHEFGHLLDYGRDNLSLQSEFASVRCAYEMHMDALADENDDVGALLKSRTKYNKDYYTNPTEIFARCMEMYFAKVKRVNCSLLPTLEEMEQQFAYPVNNEALMKEVEAYFDAFLLQFAMEKAA